MTEPQDSGSFGAQATPGPFPGQQPAGGGRGSLYAVIGCVGCGVLVLIVAIVLAGIFLLGGDDPESGGASSPQTTAPVISTEPRSLREPNPAGTALRIPLVNVGGDLEVSFSAVDWDAGKALGDHDPNLEPAPEGEKYILVTATFTYRGPGSIHPLYDAIVTYHDDVGGQVDRAQGVLSENGILDISNISDGESAEYDYIFTVPTDSEPKGAFGIEEFLGDSDVVYFVAVA